MMAVAIFIYQNLDNIDGKQARRTSNHTFNLETGSPLGMMFDHGVDSLCSFMLALQFLEIIRMTNFNIIILVLFVFIMLPFFSALWNQYSTGNFKLGRVNPVDEGLPSLAIGALLFLFIPTDHLSDFHIFAPLNV
jgi:ethanolaminephosphotransferase